jgi:predicted DNA-binding protein (UPF0251 family)
VAEREKWTGIVCEILRHAGQRATAGLREAEQASVPSELERAIQSTRARHTTRLEDAKREGLAEFAPEERIEKKRDMQSFFDRAKLTHKQREVASFRWEYELPVVKIARRTGKHRKTVDELLAAAQKKIDQAVANERRERRKVIRAASDMS